MKKYVIILVAFLGIMQSAWSHSKDIKPEFVDTLIEPYLAIQTALAADDFDKAKVGADNYMKALRKGPAKMGKPSILKIETAVDQIQKAKDIKIARTAFLTLSNEMKSMISHVGVTSDAPLYLAHCPMAFGNKGGSWIQGDKTIANPYYGAMMLRCGSVKEQVAGKKTASEHKNHGHDHSNHKHHEHSDHAKLLPASPEIIKAQAKDYPNVCVVSDEPLVEGEIEDYIYEGHLVRFCCNSCKKDFLKDPAGYMAKLAKLKKGAKSHSNHTGHDHSSHSH